MIGTTGLKEIELEKPLWCFLLLIDKTRATGNTYMDVGVMEGLKR